MNSQGDIQNIANISCVSAKNDQVSDLMKSIQNKLSMLACDDSIGDFEASKLDSPQRQLLTVTNQKRNKFRMNINDLQTSNRKDTKQSPSRLGESRIVSRINQMQHFYMTKIQQMATKMSSLQFDLETLSNKNEELHHENQMLKQSLARKQRQQSQIINRRLDQLKSELISKFSREAEQHFEKHIKQMRSINEELLEQRGKRKYLEQEISLLKNQKNNLEQFYRDLLQNHRNLIRLDIQKSQNTGKQRHYYNKIESMGKKSAQQQQKNTVKKKGKKKEKQPQPKKSQKLTNQQMIPYLAKGIQEIKDKLKLND